MLRRIMIVALVALALVVPVRPPTASAAPRCFPEAAPAIVDCIDGRVRAFWEQNGGLPVFGYPLSPLILEQGEGQPVQVQLFERVRIELHPENAPPYDVLLGQLGREAFARSGETEPAPTDPQEGCRFFAETGQNLCSPFLEAWQRYGLDLDQPGISAAESLALFGLPLGPAEQATLSDGQRYTIQWFERARFEDHGELGVLFGLLGHELAAVGGAPQPTTPEVALPPADAVAARLQVAAGFQVRGFATGLASPRLMTVGPDGQLYVAERSAGRITRLPDLDRNGLADSQETVVSGLNGPHSMEWVGNCLYVAENDAVSRHCDGDGDGSLEQQTSIAALPTGGGHTSRTLHVGPDGKLYVAAGSSCNVCVEDDPRRAAILRFNLDGSIPEDNPYANATNPLRRPVWAEGLRNSIDFLFMPDGQLWANHNGRDNMVNDQVKNDKPLEELIIPVQGGRHHGWPYCTSERVDGNPAPGPGPYAEVADPSADVPAAPGGFSCGQAVPASFTALAHSAPIGMARYAGTNFPPDYQGDIFVALHGSWNREPPAPCQVVRVRVADGQPVAAEPFLSNFQDNPGQACQSGYGRPAGVAVGADGALYISDDDNGQVYRIVATPERVNLAIALA